jgi:hypothetical protein
MTKVYNNIPETDLSDLHKAATGYVFFVDYTPEQINHLHCNPKQGWNILILDMCYVDSSWKVMAHGDAREGKWRENW